MTVVRGIRGATTVRRNDEAEILEATAELLHQIIQANQLQPESIASVFITMTTDLDAAFPARAVRQLAGWEYVPLMCSTEIPVKGSLPRCIRLMIQVNTDKAQHEMVHVYLNEAKSLRPDLSRSSG
jgi:chorismate mutase